MVIERQNALIGVVIKYLESATCSSSEEQRIFRHCTSLERAVDTLGRTRLRNDEDAVFVLRLAALLHDFGLVTFPGRGQTNIGRSVDETRHILADYGVSLPVVTRVIRCIQTHKCPGCKLHKLSFEEREFAILHACCRFASLDYLDVAKSKGKGPALRMLIEDYARVRVFDPSDHRWEVMYSKWKERLQATHG